jgi:hypothetical protein
VNTSEWISRLGVLGGLSVLGAHAPILFDIVFCAFAGIIGTTAVVGYLHSNEDKRADARKVLKQLLGYGGRRRTESGDRKHQLPTSSVTTQQRSNGDEQSREQAPSGRQKDRARPKHSV